MPLSEAQMQLAVSKARFRVLCSGRRFGKTYFIIRELCRFAAKAPKQQVWYVAPTYKQAKAVAWDMLKDRLMPLNWIEKTNENELSIRLKNGSKIILKGADKPDSLRGVFLDFACLDEVADIDEDAWNKVLRPALADREGHALFAGTPKGRNWFYDLYLRGLSEDPLWRGWESWHFTTLQGGNVTPEELEEAQYSMDPLTFKQEFLADWIDFEGRAYNYDASRNASSELKYNNEWPLIFCFDFNVSPGVAVVCQEQPLPNGEYGTGVIGEVYIPRNSTTIAVCNKLISDWGDHKGLVYCYGDASGGAKASAKVAGTDWDLIKYCMRNHYAERVDFRYRRKNPFEKVRVNAVNTRLQSASGIVRLMVDSEKAPNVEKDLEGVMLLEGGSGEIDKKKDEKLTHLSDGLGYYCEYEFPIYEVEAAHNIKMPGRRYG